MYNRCQCVTPIRCTFFYPVSDLCLNPPLSSPIGVMCQRGGVCAWGAAYIEGKSYLHSRSDTYSNIIYIY